MKISLTRTQWAMVLTIVLASAPYFIRLGASSLWDSNEAFYAETPREMIESGDYVNPEFNYRPRLNKPPLSYWVVVPFFKVFGASEAAERLPIAIGALILIATAFALGRAVFSLNAGLLAAICLATSPRFLMFSRRILIDIYVSMFMALALLMFVLAQSRPRRRRLYLVLMYASVGLGVLTKGPVAALLPVIVVCVYLATLRNLKALRDLMLPAGAAIVALIVLPWYVAIYAHRGSAHIWSFLLKDNLSRYTEQIWGPNRGPFFYIPVIIGDIFPWSLFLLPLLWIAVARLVKVARGEKHRTAERGSTREPSLAGLMVAWVIVIVVFFSISRSKEDLYILPVYPAIAALLGGALARFRGEQRLDSMRWTGFAVGLVFVTLGGLELWFLGRGTQPYHLAGASCIGWSCVVGGLACAAGALLDRMTSATFAIAVTLIACNWVFVLRTLPDFERYKPARALSEVIAAQADAEAIVGYYRTAYPSMVFYLRRPIFEYYDPADVEAAFWSGREVFCVMTATDFEAMRSRLPDEVRVLASRPIFQVKLRSILDRVEPPQVLLISNKGGSGVNR